MISGEDGHDLMYGGAGYDTMTAGDDNEWNLLAGGSEDDAMYVGPGYDLFDMDGWVENANRMLDRPGDFRGLGMAGARMIHGRYSLGACLPQRLALYEHAMSAPLLVS